MHDFYRKCEMSKIISRIVTIVWNSRNRKYYVGKGYRFMKYGDEFKVRVEDLSKGSMVEVTVRCDICRKEWN